MSGSKVIGHLDWGAKHCRVQDNAISAVYDWDSVARVTETRVVGSAAVTFTTTWYVECNHQPEISEMISFVAEYQDARAEPFSTSEFEEITAAIYYQAAYTARCEHAGNQGQKDTKAEHGRFLELLISVDIDGQLKK